MKSLFTKYYIVIFSFVFILGSGNSCDAQQLLLNGDFNLTTTDWVTSCTSVEATYFETVYGGTDGTNHVAEVDDESCFHQDICILPGATYVYSMVATRRTTGAPDTVISHLKITGLNAGGTTLATYVDMDYTRTNTIFGFTPVTGIPLVVVPALSGVVRLRVELTDNTPGYATYGMIVDNLSLTFLTPPAVFSVDTACQNTPVAFSVTGVSSPAITYLWTFSAGATPGTSTSSNPSISWSTAGPASGRVVLGNGACYVDTVNFGIYIGGIVHTTYNDTTCSNVPYNFRGTLLGVSGTYTATATSISSCDTILTLNLYVRPIITGSVAATICDGTTYSISGHTYTTSGVYNVDTVANAAGCDSIVILTLTVNPIPRPPVISALPSNYCPGQLFVPFTISGTGVLWYGSASGGAGNPITPVVNTSVAGTYSFWASQTVLGCESSRTLVTVTVSDNLTADFTSQILYGCTADTVVFTNNSVGAATYRWSFGDISPVSLARDVTHVYTSQQVFTVTLITANAPCLDSVKKAINLVHPMQASFVADTNLICQGKAITFTDLSSGTGGIAHFWSFGDGATSIALNPVHNYPNQGVYHVYEVVTDFVPCHDTAYATITVDTVSPITMAVTDTGICVGTYITFTGNYSTIGNTGVTWKFGNGDSIKNINPAQYAYQSAGTYSISATSLYRVCPDTTVTRQVTVLAQPALNLGPDTSVCKGSNPVVLSDRLNAQTAGASWLWNTGETTPAITINIPGTYSATVKIGGCSSTYTVNVKNDCYMDIPNVFSPNGDGVNDYFMPRNYLTSGMTNFKMDIFNRWGQLIFETTSLEGRGWDGRFNNTDQPEGVYVYEIDGAFKDGQHSHLQGNLTLIR